MVNMNDVHLAGDKPEAANQEAKGYVCTCGEAHEYPMYVFAHWTEELTHQCKACGRNAYILRGIADIEEK